MNFQPTEAQYSELEQEFFQIGSDLDQSRAWAKAWKEGARHYKDLFNQAVAVQVKWDKALEDLVRDIEAGEVGPSSLDVLPRLYDIRREFP